MKQTQWANSKEITDWLEQSLPKIKEALKQLAIEYAPTQDLRMKYIARAWDPKLPIVKNFYGKQAEITNSSCKL